MIWSLKYSNNDKNSKLTKKSKINYLKIYFSPRKYNLYYIYIYI